MADPIEVVIKNLIKNGLIDYNVPTKIIDTIVQNIVNAVRKPEVQKSGACVMTGEASMAADRQRKGQYLPSDAKPQIM